MLNNNKIIFKFFLSIFLFSFSLSNKQSKTFTYEDLQSMKKFSSPILSNDGNYLVYSTSKWDSETHKTTTKIEYLDINTNQTYSIPNEEENSDTSPTFSKIYPNYLFFLRTNKEGFSAIYYIDFPVLETSIPIQLTNYPLSINSYKLKADSIVVNVDMYFNCSDMNCSKTLIDEEQKRNYKVYTSLFAFHWDEWLTEGKGTHLFFQKFISINNTLTLLAEPYDITAGMEVFSPPHFEDDYYDISNDGNKVTFTAQLRTYNEAWSTSWKTYYIDINMMNKPILIIGNNQARTVNPKFSLDDTQIAFLAANRPMLEGDFLHIEIYNILTNKIRVLNNTLDLSVSDFKWVKNNKIYFIANYFQVYKLFQVEIEKNTENYTIFNVKNPELSYGLPIISKTKIVLEKYGFNHPNQIVDIENEYTILNLNSELISQISLSTPEVLNFTSQNGDTVYGFIFKPINFQSNEKYPLAVLIHGGPESSFSQSWGYRWNPQMWANQGYSVLMINFHGSSGFSQKFQDEVRDDYGGLAYYDIIDGINYVINNYNYIDKEKICAAGASYGGFMINWLQGHNNLLEKFNFKCFVVHDGDFSMPNMFYATDEIFFAKAEYCKKDNIDCNPFEEGARENMFKWAPETLVNNWSTPMMVIHGGKDYRVSLSEGLGVFTSLRLKNIESKMLFFPQENHWVLKPENQIKWMEEVIAWFDKYAKKN